MPFMIVSKAEEIELPDRKSTFLPSKGKLCWYMYNTK